MVKKFFLGMMAVAGLAAVSCESNLEPAVEAGKEVVVSIEVGTPEIATRAYSDGMTATVLQYAVYDEAGNELTDLTVTDAEIHGKTTVEFKLTTGNKYSMIFWAAAPEAPYDVDFAEQTMTVNYNKAVSNDENRDAFYTYVEPFTVTGPMSKTIVLKRPFAQLNIGTNDFEDSEAAGYLPTQSKVTVPVSSSLNLVSGAVNEAVATTFGFADFNRNETFPVKGYEYLAMNYLLVGAEKGLVEVEFAYTDGTVEKSRKVGSVPVQRNHRTNLYGQLLTNDVEINVEILPDYDDPDLPSTDEDKLNIAAQLGGTVVLSGDVELKNPIVVKGIETKSANAGAVLEIDLNGYALTYTSDVAAHSAMITVNSGSTLIVKDSKGTGKISYNYTGAGDPAFGWGTYTIANSGKLVVENGTVEIVSDINDGSVNHMYSAIWQYSGSMTINGGTISNANYRSARLWKGDMTINGGTFEGQVWVQAVDNSSVLTINGGNFAPTGVDGSSVFVTNDTYKVALKVTDGNFATKIGCSVFTKEGVAGTVSGGVFGSINDALIAEGYEAVENNGKFYVVPEGSAVASSQTELADALANGETEIILAAGTYEVPAAKGKTVKFIGAGAADETVFTITKAGGEGASGLLDGSNVTFENLTIQTDSKNYTGFARCKGTYVNCVINGTYTLYADSSFENCTFNVSGDVYNVWTWGAAVAYFNNCTFNSDGKAMLLYGTVNTKLTIENSVFNDNGGLADLKAAIEIGNDYNTSYELIVNKTVVNGYEINDKGINTGTTLWANKNSMSQEKLNVVVDGVDVY